MKMQDFIFSNNLKHRISRHLALWIAFSIYFFIVNFFPKSANDLVTAKTYLDAFQKMIYIPISVFSVYVSIYFLLPRFIITGKYLKFFVLFFCLCFINLCSAYLLTKPFGQFSQKNARQRPPVQSTIYYPFIYGLGLGLAASGSALIIKLIKIRYLKQKENEQLQQQKITTELQMIKTNFHPHFLSDALQNISGLIHYHSEESPQLILKLSDLLSFILYESEAELISLEQELRMMRKYLELEKTFYGNRIVINVNEQGSTTGHTIAPLILLSLVQNCCEQCLISLQQKLNIDIETVATDKEFTFRLTCNGYYENLNGNALQNMGLNQSLRRIQVIYPNKHKLETKSENGIFSLLLKLDLEAIAAKSVTLTEAQSLYEFS